MRLVVPLLAYPDARLTFSHFRPSAVSAGYDAAKGDELGKMLVSPDGYAHMTHMLSALAGGKLLLALEGGYNVNSIAESAYACVKVIVGDELPAMPALGSATLAATNTVADVKRFQAQYWQSMGYAVESDAGAFAHARSLRAEEKLMRRIGCCRRAHQGGQDRVSVQCVPLIAFGS